MFKFLFKLFCFIIFLLLIYSCDSDISSKEDLNGFKLTFDVGDGDEIEAKIVEEGKVVVKPTDPKRDGLIFDGWYKDDKFSENFDFNNPIVSDTTVYAKWANKVVISFEVNGGNSIGRIEIKEGLKVTQPSDPVKANFVFDGWYKDDKFSENFDFNSPIVGYTTVYAKWLANINKAKISFNVNGGSAITDVLVDYGSKVSKPADPTKTGYNFLGWYKENTFQNPFDFDANISTDTVIYAKFNGIPFKKNSDKLMWTRLTYEKTYFGETSTAVIGRFEFDDYFEDTEGGKLTYTYISAFQNGGSVNRKGDFSMLFGRMGTKLKPHKNSGDRGYFRVRVRATDPLGASIDFYVNFQSTYENVSPESIDMPSITTDVILASSDVIASNYHRTGSGNDFCFFPFNGIYDYGTGNDLYRVSKATKNSYIYNFNDDDKLLISIKDNQFKDYTFSSYTSYSDVVATGTSRIIYITSTGELYRDQNGDAVYKSSDTSIDLKTGDDDSRMFKLYSSSYVPGQAAENNGTPADFDADNYELADFYVPSDH